MTRKQQQRERYRDQRNAWVQGRPKIDHAPDDLCGGRRLTGAEFAQRAAELMARDAAERAKREAGI